MLLQGGGRQQDHHLQPDRGSLGALQHAAFHSRQCRRSRAMVLRNNSQPFSSQHGSCRCGNAGRGWKIQDFARRVPKDCRPWHPQRCGREHARQCPVSLGRRIPPLPQVALYLYNTNPSTSLYPMLNTLTRVSCNTLTRVSINTLMRVSGNTLTRVLYDVV